MEAVSAEVIHKEAKSVFVIVKDRVSKIRTEAIEKFGSEEKIKHVGTLAKIGFGKAKNITKDAEEVAKYEREMKIHKMYEYYDKKYVYRFIDYVSLLDVAAKYNLIIGWAADFIEAIPEKNQREITNFRFDSKDYADFPCHMIEKYTVIQGGIKKLTTPPKADLEKYCNLTPEAGERIELFNPIVVATTNHFSKDYSIEKRTILPKDPIVGQPVKGGIIIATAWGDEASDEKVVNQKMQ